MPKDNGFIPGQSNSPQEYVFNAKTGFPKEVEQQFQDYHAANAGKPFGYNQHAEERANSKLGLHPHQILPNGFPSLDSGWSPFEIKHNGKDITSFGLSGPHSNSHNATITFRPGDKGPVATTAWLNDKNDTHSTLDQLKLHHPEEFVMGQPPKRKLKSAIETQQPGYQPIPWHSGKSKRRILQQLGLAPKAFKWITFLKLNLRG